MSVGSHRDIDFPPLTFQCRIARVRTRIYFLLGLALLLACAPALKRVVIVADGQRRVLETQAATVNDVLREQKILLGENDRVDPPDFTPLDRNTAITIVRVTVKSETVTETIPFERKIIRDDTLAQGKTRVLQLGANGSARVKYQIIYEDGSLTTRREIGRESVAPAHAEVIAVGTQGSLAAVPFKGTLVYLANGNAWVMRNSSDDKRLLAATNDLDGRVFDLSPDAQWLAFTRADNPKELNSAWVVNTVLLDERPRDLALANLLYAQWQRDPATRGLAYSTGDKTPGAPGWKAHNDLQVASLANLGTTDPLTLSTRQVLAPSNPAWFSWWGMRFDWSPDGRVIAYALADRVGLINVETGASRVLKQFAYYRTRADWVWTPGVSWSPDSRFLVTTLHALPAGAGLFEDSQEFDVGLLARDDSVSLTPGRDVGMWSAPVWSPANGRGESKIAYGVALDTANTERSRYALWIMDRDGSNKKRILPQTNEDGLEVIRLAWSPDTTHLAALRDGDVWLYDLTQDKWSQLTANGDVQWVKWK